MTLVTQRESYLLLGSDKIAVVPTDDSPIAHTPYNESCLFAVPIGCGNIPHVFDAFSLSKYLDTANPPRCPVCMENSFTQIKYYVPVHSTDSKKMVLQQIGYKPFYPTSILRRIVLIIEAPINIIHWGMYSVINPITMIAMGILASLVSFIFSETVVEGIKLLTNNVTTLINYLILPLTALVHLFIRHVLRKPCLLKDCQNRSFRIIRQILYIPKLTLEVIAIIVSPLFAFFTRPPSKNIYGIYDELTRKNIFTFRYQYIQNRSVFEPKKVFEDLQKVHVKLRILLPKITTGTEAIEATAKRDFE